MRSVIAALFSLMIAASAWGQASWRPEKQVEIILPTAPGGGNDTVARLMQKMLQDQKAVTTPIVVLNKSGGNQTVSVAYHAQHRADPHYLLFATSSFFTNHIQAAVSSAAGSTPPVVAGQLRMLAIAAPQRRPGALAAVPTLIELGLDAPVLATWRGIFGTRGITPAQIAFWEDALARGFQGDEWKAWMIKNDVSAPPLRGAALAQYLDAQFNNTKSVLVELGLAK
jgi:tripartite-type tricarboxylate transporter receptor subunit TctC